VAGGGDGVLGKGIKLWRKTTGGDKGEGEGRERNGSAVAYSPISNRTCPRGPGGPS
jgi:hypothetical protein